MFARSLFLRLFQFFLAISGVYIALIAGTFYVRDDFDLSFAYFLIAAGAGVGVLVLHFLIRQFDEELTLEVGRILYPLGMALGVIGAFVSASHLDGVLPDGGRERHVFFLACPLIVAVFVIRTFDLKWLRTLEESGVAKKYATSGGASPVDAMEFIKARKQARQSNAEVGLERDFEIQLRRKKHFQPVHDFVAQIADKPALKHDSNVLLRDSPLSSATDGDIAPFRKGMYVFSETEVGFYHGGESVFYATVDRYGTFRCGRNNINCGLCNAKEIIEQISEIAARRGVGEL